jgi:rubrerythrin
MAENATLKVLSQALKLEREGREFYLKAAEEADDEKGRAMFLSLADDETKHADIITRQLHGIEGGGTYVLLPQLDAPAIDLGRQLFPPELSKVVAKIGTNPDEVSALHVALEMEIKSYDLYRSAARDTADVAGKTMYQWLASAEMTHFNLLMLNYESIVSGGSWV